jgi:hypothetical protein
MLAYSALLSGLAVSPVDEGKVIIFQGENKNKIAYSCWFT